MELTFIQQLVARWKSEMPTLFKVINFLSIACIAVAGLPMILQTLGITLPESIAPLASKVVLVAGLVGGFISKLTVKSPDTGKVLTDTLSQ